jgi:hypothetical protein
LTLAVWAAITFPIDDVIFADPAALTTYESSPGFSRSSCQTCSCLVSWTEHGSKEIDVSYALFPAEQLANSYKLCVRLRSAESSCDAMPQGPASVGEPGPGRGAGVGQATRREEPVHGVDEGVELGALPVMSRSGRHEMYRAKRNAPSFSSGATSTRCS